MVVFETDTGYLRVWDGSAWDYLSQSQGATTNLPISDIGKAWTSWTPTYGSSGGAAPTTITTNRAVYSQIQKNVTLHIDFTITTLGSASGFMTFTLPVTAANTRDIGIGREIASTGNAVVFDNVAATSCWVLGYAAGNTATSGYRYTGNITYEAA
jgi:hypothetical protein